MFHELREIDLVGNQARLEHVRDFTIEDRRITRIVMVGVSVAAHVLLNMVRRTSSVPLGIQRTPVMDRQPLLITGLKPLLAIRAMPVLGHRLAAHVVRYIIQLSPRVNHVV